MASKSIRDILTSFSPSLDFCAITSGDGRIKIWDTLKGQVQAEFTDITLTDGTFFETKSQSGHLSVDYSCIKWVSLESKKKRRPGSSLLILGTGSGDLFAIDVSSGHLRWKINDCHPGGVSAISFSGSGSCIYTAGADGMICQIDATAGSLLARFKSSAKAISSMSISSDGQTLAIASAQLKVFNCSDFKKIQKFSGHPASVGCMIFTEDGKYILSSAVGERYVAVWKIHGGKKQHSSCVLSMDHPAVFLDTKCIDNGGKDGVGLLVLAISELGVCYAWYGRNVEELQNARPAKISLIFEGPIPKSKKASIPTIFAGRLQGSAQQGSGVVFVAYGSIAKPTFEKLQVQHGSDINLYSSQDGVLLRKPHSFDSQKGQILSNEVTALDRANAEDAILPVPKFYSFHDKKRKHDMRLSSVDHDEEMVDFLPKSKDELMQVKSKEEGEKAEGDTGTMCMEDKLRSLGILGKEVDLSRERNSRVDTSMAPTSTISDARLLIEANLPPNKMRVTISSMSGKDAFELLIALLAMWKSRSGSGKDVVLWIFGILLCHGHYVLSQEPVSQVLDSVLKMTRPKCVALQPLLQLSGRLRLISAQIDKAGEDMVQTLPGGSVVDESEDEVDELIYGEEEDQYQSGSQGDNWDHQP